MLVLHLENFFRCCLVLLSQVCELFFHVFDLLFKIFVVFLHKTKFLFTNISLLLIFLREFVGSWDELLFQLLNLSNQILLLILGFIFNPFILFNQSIQSRLIVFLYLGQHISQLSYFWLILFQKSIFRVQIYDRYVCDVFRSWCIFQSW